MEGISGYVGAMAQSLQRTVSMSVMKMSMNQGTTLVPEMLSKMPAPSPSVPQGQPGFNMDVYA